MSTLILYKSGGGAQDIDLVQVMPDPQYQAVKRAAIRYLRADYAPAGVIAILEEFPFTLWQATNHFGDEFEVLYMKASMEQYVAVENETDGWGTRIQDGLPRIAQAFKTVGHHLRFIAVGLDLDEGIADVSPPTLTITSDIVEEALRHAETLIGKHGAAGALDRVHTAFHGYLENACKNAGISVAQDTGITALLALLREHHPSLDITEPEDKARLDQVMRGIARIVDALDPLRNRKSMAHPNVLLPEPEARLVLNQIRTILQYLDAKLR